MPAMIGGRLARWSPWTLDAGAVLSGDPSSPSVR
jgi:hypothetical protein